MRDREREHLEIRMCMLHDKVVHSDVAVVVLATHSLLLFQKTIINICTARTLSKFITEKITAFDEALIARAFSIQCAMYIMKSRKNAATKGKRRKKQL